MKKPRFSRPLSALVQSTALLATALLATALAVTSGSALAANATWNGNVNGTWTTAGNWTSSVPGMATGTSSADVATFNNNSANTTITVDTTRSLYGLLFDTGAGAYTFTGGTFDFSANSGSGINANAIIVNSGVTANQTIANNITAYRGSGGGGFGFTNNSASALLTISGNVTGISTGITTLLLAGSGNSVISGTIADGGGALSINKMDGGSWTLSGANSYTGQTTVGAGTLILNFAGTNSPTSNIASSGSLILGSGNAGSATVQINGKANTTNTQTFSMINATGAASHLNLASVGTGSVAVTVSGSLTGLSAAHVTGATLDISLSGSSSVMLTSATNQLSGILGTITVNGSDFATKNASGYVTAYTGYTANTTGSLGTINQVVDMKSVDTTISSGVATSITSIAGLRFNEAADRTITLSGNRVLAVAPFNNVGAILVTSTVGAHLTKITGGLLQGISSRDLVVIQNNTAGNLQIDSVITNYSTGSESLTKSGSGTLLLTANNAYTGATYINEGTVIVAGNTVAGGTQTLTTTANSATISGVDTTNLFVGQRVTGVNVVSGGGAGKSLYIISISGNTVTLSGNAIANGAADVVFWDGGGLGNLTGSNAVQIASGAGLQIGNGGASGSLEAGQSITNNGALSFNRTDSYTFSNNVSGNGTLSQIGTGRTILTGSNSYNGGTYVNSGTLQLGAKNTLLTTGGVTVTGGVFNIDNYDQTVSSLVVNGGSVQGGTGTLTSTTAYDIRSGSVGANLAGNVGLNKTTSGTATISGSNTYTGATNISAGSVIINGSATATTTTVKTGATLSGTGKLASLIVESGAVIDPGDGAASMNGSTVSTNDIIGKLTTGDFNLKSGAHLAIQLQNAGSYDQIESTTLTLSGSLDLSLLTGATIHTGDIFYVAIADTAGAITNAFANAAEGSTITVGQQQFTITYEANWTGNAATSTYTGGNDVALLAVPEPQTWASFIGGSAMLVLLQNFRRRKNHSMSLK